MENNTPERPMHPEGEKVIMLHGFTNQEINLVVDAVKKSFPDPRRLVFAATTQTSLEYQVSRWIEELCLEKKQVMEMMRNYNKAQDSIKKD